jgi:quercetin dioxygenase-like cupin family protein
VIAVMLRLKTFAALVAALLSLGTVQAADPDPATISIIAPEGIKWSDSPMPGIKVAIMSGNPRDAGLYVVRVKFSPGSMSRPHSHPETRYITVLQGTWWAGTGEKFDPQNTVPLPAGSLAVHHPNRVHFDGAKEQEVIVQISGIGPSATNFANPADDPKNRNQ